MVKKEGEAKAQLVHVHLPLETHNQILEILEIETQGIMGATKVRLLHLTRIEISLLPTMISQIQEELSVESVMGMVIFKLNVPPT